MLHGISTNFIDPGHFHEYVPFGGDKYELVYIEGIEIIGGQVFLGVRYIHQFTSETDFVLSKEVLYDSIFRYSRLQKYGTAAKIDAEAKVYKDALQQAHQELTAQPQQPQQQEDNNQWRTF